MLIKKGVQLPAHPLILFVNRMSLISIIYYDQVSPDIVVAATVPLIPVAASATASN